MPYTDAQGRPELVVHPDIVKGTAAYRITPPAAGADPERGPEPTSETSRPPKRRPRRRAAGGTAARRAAGTDAGGA